MYAASRMRRRGQSADYWPGFVDLLSTLLLVMIFLLVVYMLAQYFLQRTLSEETDRLDDLSVQISSLADMLSLEQQANAELRLNITQLSSQLQASLSDRDRLSGQLSLVSEERDTLRLRLREMTGEGQTAMAEASMASQAEVEAALRAEAGEEKVKVLLADIERLRRDIDALQAVRADLELKVVTLVAALVESREELAVSQDEFDKKQITLDENQAALALLRIALDKNRGELSKSQDELNKSQDALKKSQDALKKNQIVLDGEMAALALLRIAFNKSQDELGKHQAELDKSQNELSMSQAELDASRQEILRMVAALTALRDTAAELEERLSDEQERTALTQRTLKEREIRLAEVQALHLASQSSLTDSESVLSENRRLSARQRDQIGLLNQQIAALRIQLARIEEALEISERKSEDQQVTIANLGQRLNQALAAKVEELAAYRSEFFGRLRQVLSDRRDFTIIGDRFVFQSEVLFASASDELGDAGEDRLATFAGILKEVMVRIPTDLPWILQVDGHTDSRPIQTARFPSNWELSSARAISVVNFLIDRGIPPQHLSATGYGEFQPIDARDDEIGYRRNRRIELKLTQR